METPGYPENPYCTVPTSILGLTAATYRRTLQPDTGGHKYQGSLRSGPVPSSKGVPVCTAAGADTAHRVRRRSSYDEATNRTRSAAQPSRACPSEGSVTVGTQDRGGPQAVLRSGERRSEPSFEGERVTGAGHPAAVRTLPRKAVRFMLMSAAIVAVSLATAALFSASLPDDHFASTSALPKLAAWMGGALVGLAAGIAALFKAGTHR